MSPNSILTWISLLGPGKCPSYPSSHPCLLYPRSSVLQKKTITLWNPNAIRSLFHSEFPVGRIKIKSRLYELLRRNLACPPEFVSVLGVFLYAVENIGNFVLRNAFAYLLIALLFFSKKITHTFSLIFTRLLFLTVNDEPRCGGSLQFMLYLTRRTIKHFEIIVFVMLELSAIRRLEFESDFLKYCLIYSRP